MSISEIQRQALSSFFNNLTTAQPRDTSSLEKQPPPSINIPSSLDTSREDEPTIGDIKYIDGVAHIYTAEGWVIKDEVDKETEVVGPDSAFDIIIGPPKPPDIVDDDADADAGPPVTITDATHQINNSDRLRPIDIQIAKIQDQLDSFVSSSKRTSLNSQLSDLVKQRDKTEKDINKTSYSQISDVTKESSSYDSIDATDKPISSEVFLNADTSNLRTMDDYAVSNLVNKVAIDFFNENAEEGTAEDMMYYFRKEISLDDMIRRAVNVEDWSDEQKKRYLWLRETFDKTDWSESSRSRKMLSIGEYTWQAISDPATVITLLTTPFTGGASVAARTSAQTASKLAFRHILMNSLKTNLSTKAIQQVASNIATQPLKTTLVGTPARTAATYGFTYGAIADTLMQEKAIGLDEQEERDYWRIIKTGGLFALAGGTLGKIVDATPGAAKYLTT